jgi:hypothetical protein
MLLVAAVAALVALAATTGQVDLSDFGRALLRQLGRVLAAT